MIALEQGELCDAETAIKSYWALFRDLIYAKVARLDAGQTETPGAPDEHGNVMVQTSNSTHDVEHEIHFLKTRFMDRHTSGPTSPRGKEFDDQCREAFVTPLLSIVPDPKFVPTLIRLYAQDIFPNYDVFTSYSDDLHSWFEYYAEAKNVGLLKPEEFPLGAIVDPGEFEAITNEIDRRLEQDATVAKKRKSYN